MGCGWQIRITMVRRLWLAEWSLEEFRASSVLGKFTGWYLPPPSPLVYWNHRVSGKILFDLWAATTCGQNLRSKGLSPLFGWDEDEKELYRGFRGWGRKSMEKFGPVGPQRLKPRCVWELERYDWKSYPSRSCSWKDRGKPEIATLSVRFCDRGPSSGRILCQRVS
jgi:hypothetical protein